MKSKNFKILFLLVLFSLVGIITYTAVNYINTMNVPEDIRKSTGAVQNYGKPVSLTDSKSSVAIGVFYPKTNNPKANAVFEDIAKKYMNDAKTQTKNYKPDTNIPAQYRTDKQDYYSPYNRGHMVASSDRLYSREANSQTFYYSNISPQLITGFNQGGSTWDAIENKVQ